MVFLFFFELTRQKNKQNEMTHHREWASVVIESSDGIEYFLQEVRYELAHFGNLFLGKFFVRLIFFSSIYLCGNLFLIRFFSENLF